MFDTHFPQPTDNNQKEKEEIEWKTSSLKFFPIYAIQFRFRSLCLISEISFIYAFKLTRDWGQWIALLLFCIHQPTTINIDWIILQQSLCDAKWIANHVYFYRQNRDNQLLLCWFSCSEENRSILIGGYTMTESHWLHLLVTY